MMDMTPECTIVMSIKGGVTVCNVSGIVDHTCMTTFRGAVVALARHRVAVLDLSDVHFIDSAGLGMVIAAVRTSADRAGEMAIVASQPHLARLFNSVGIDRLAPVVPTLRAALRAVAEADPPCIALSGGAGPAGDE